ncbi:PepSY domain-containing protein [Methylomonas sp. DH-1]|uniref:PepSY domain-containing protein n=1 Tax=Methylomonas sp. (strain DH-1) TaxID=1727196 RepID=UPI0009EEF1BB|nr:PepSY-associated TM helix domain-containing protein [Methylomonas sp. DH-1]
MKIRSFWVLLHRYAGLVMTAFLIVVSISGSLLAFLPELEALINPQWLVQTVDGKPLAGW